MEVPSSVCSSCGFENPRAWHACARCGLGLSSASRGTGLSSIAIGSGGRVADPTMVSAPPEMVPGEDNEEAKISEFPAASLSSSPPGPAPDPEPPLIGQLEASEAVRTGVERAFSLGAPTLVALEGQRGSGKTRMLIYASEIAARIDGNVRVAYGACRLGGDGTYAPFSRMLLERFGVTPASSPSSVRGQMSTQVSKALMSKDALAVAETTHLLGHVAGIPFPQSPFLVPLKKDPEELHRKACAAVKRFFEGEAEQRPVLILLDNMQEAEDEAWDMVAALTQAAGHLAVVIAGAPPIAERAQQLDPPGGVAVGPVAPLGESDIAAMLHVILPTLVEAPEPLVAALAHRSEGNPSAVRDLVLALFEAGVFVPDDQGLNIDLERLSAGEGLPVNLDDAIQARLDRLDDLERETLSRAAVVGEVFWDGALLGQMRSERKPPGDGSDPLSVWPDDDDSLALGAALDRLVDKGFLMEHDGSDLLGSRQFAFNSSHARELLERVQGDETRTGRHRSVARWLAVVAEYRREGVARMIAPHLEAAGQLERAGRAYLEAANFEQRGLRTNNALRFADKALELLPPEDVARRIEALHVRGSTLALLGRGDEAIADFTSMLELAWNIGARGKGGAALNRIGRAHRQRGENERARQVLDRALALFRAAGDLRGVASTLDDLSQVDLLRGDTDAALDEASEGLELRRSHGDARGEALSLNTLGQIELHRGNLDVADELFRQSLRLRQELGDTAGVVQCHNALGILSYERGDVAGAITAWEAALEQARKMGDLRRVCFILNNIGEARGQGGALEQATRALDEAAELAQEMNDLRGMAEVSRNRGLLALRQGDDDAEELVLLAVERAEAYGAPEAIAAAHRAVGALRARTLFDATGKVDRRAEESYLTSIDMFRDAGSEKEAARSLAELGMHLIERGDLETARERLSEARAIMRRMGLAELEKIEQTLAQLT
ncbi:MAG: tetratricopeptide repeat protein [Deltaproteobacteria bacterium]|nr:tetratricopeptide repeat protein [Deltaproteobacteria bacterium]